MELQLRPASRPRPGELIFSDLPTPRFRWGQSVAYEFNDGTGKRLRAEGVIVGSIYPAQSLAAESPEWGYFVVWTAANYPGEIIQEPEEFPESLLIANSSAVGGAE